jgi:hypothetical protein
MRKIYLLLVVSMLIGLAQAQAPFKSYTSPDAKFTINFPGPPKVSAPAQQETEQGRAFTEQHYDVADDAAYIVLTTDFPFAVDNKALDTVAKEQAASCGASTPKIQSDNEYQGRSALLFTVDCPKSEKREALALIVRAVADRNRLYRVMYGTTEKPDTDRVLTFLTSFHIN